jgi:DeoR/GlpR family transcriptional regulator of sugar metabolism
MDADERRRSILELARRTGSVDVGKLSADFGVAKETVRRDLRVLEEHGLVRRTHGGAYPVESAGFETTLAFRETMHVPEKSRIAAAAGELAGDAETVFIDEGFTPQLIAQALPRDRPLTVVTASLATAGVLATREHTTVLLLGGRLRGGTMATVGHWATHMLAGFVIDLAFVGANGISREYGLTTPDPAGVPAPSLRGGPYQVRGGQLLPLRRGVRLRDDHHRHRTAPVRGPPLLAAGSPGHPRVTSASASGSVSAGPGCAVTSLS